RRGGGWAVVAHARLLCQLGTLYPGFQPDRAADRLVCDPFDHRPWAQPMAEPARCGDLVGRTGRHADSGRLFATLPSSILLSAAAGVEPGQPALSAASNRRRHGTYAVLDGRYQCIGAAAGDAGAVACATGI